MICRLIPDSPAEQCGQFQLYDELLAVNGKDVTQMDHDDIVQLIKASSVVIKLVVQQPEGQSVSVCVCVCVYARTCVAS